MVLILMTGNLYSRVCCQKRNSWTEESMYLKILGLKVKVNLKKSISLSKEWMDRKRDNLKIKEGVLHKIDPQVANIDQLGLPQVLLGNTWENYCQGIILMNHLLTRLNIIDFNNEIKLLIKDRSYHCEICDSSLSQTSSTFFSITFISCKI